MAGGLKTLLKRWRDQYYISQVLAHAAQPIRFLAAHTARQIEQKVRKNSVTIRLPSGKNMSIARDSGIGLASSLFWHGLNGFEPDTSRTLRFFFERAATFIDVGANCGFYSILGTLWNSELKVVAFEPVPSIFEILKRNARLNEVAERVRCENIALSSKSGKTSLYLPKSENMDIETTGTLVRDGWQTRIGSPSLEVEAVRFDEYEARRPIRVDLIKIDVEDHEADVMQGMTEIVKRDHPFIVCEILPRPHGNQRTREIVEAFNYQPYWITSAGYIKVPRFDFERGNFTDFVLSPVSTPAVVLDKLEVLWELNQARIERAV